MPTPSVNAASPLESHGPPVGEVVQPSAPSKSLMGRLLYALRGDKYMADAYPPNWHGSAPATSDHDAPAQAPRPGVG
jgi:hypothetical protein